MEGFPPRGGCTGLAVRPPLPTARGDLVGCSLTLQVCPGGTLSGWRRGRAGKSSGARSAGSMCPSFPSEDPGGPSLPEAHLSRRSLGPPVPSPDSRLTPGQGRASSSPLQAHGVQRHTAGLPSWALFCEVPWDRWVLLMGSRRWYLGWGWGTPGWLLPTPAPAEESCMCPDGQPTPPSPGQWRVAVPHSGLGSFHRGGAGARPWHILWPGLHFLTSFTLVPMAQP